MKPFIFATLVMFCCFIIIGLCKIINGILIMFPSVLPIGLLVVLFYILGFGMYCAIKDQRNEYYKKN